MLFRLGCHRHKGQTILKANYDFLNSPKKRTKLTILSKKEAQDSEFRSFFWRIEETINCFRDLLTFTKFRLFSKSHKNLTKSQMLRSLLIIIISSNGFLVFWYLRIGKLIKGGRKKFMKESINFVKATERVVKILRPS